MPKICVVYAGRHTKHPIILRQIHTLLEAGYTLSVIDQDDTARTSYSGDYKCISLLRFQVRGFTKLMWKFVRRLPSSSLHAGFWTLVRIRNVLFGAVRPAMVAFRENADYYQAHDLSSLLPAMIAARLRKRPVIYDAHELASDQGDPASAWNHYLHWVERRLIPRADQVILPNRSRATVYLAEYSLKRDPVVILNCPRSIDVRRTNRLRESLNLPDSTRVVLYHGTLMPGRALDKLISSAREFIEGTKLVVIGEQNDYYHEVLKPLWQSEDLQDRVFFLPYVPQDEIMSYVASADLGVVIYEDVNRNNYLCAPLKLYEYFMADVPVVVCDFPELRTLLEEYHVGVTFNPANPMSIARAVNKFFELDSESRAEIKEHLSRARERFNWESEGQKLINLLSSLDKSGDGQTTS